MDRGERYQLIKKIEFHDLSANYQMVDLIKAPDQKLIEIYRKVRSPEFYSQNTHYKHF